MAVRRHYIPRSRVTQVPSGARKLSHRPMKGGDSTPLFGQLPKRGRTISAAEAFEMHKRRIQEGYEPKKAANRSTYVAMAVQICFLVLLLAVIYGLRKADSEGRVEEIMHPMMGDGSDVEVGGMMMKRTQQKRSRLYSRPSKDATKAWVLVGGTVDTSKGDLIHKTAALYVIKMDTADKKLDFVNEASGDVTASTKAAMHLSRSDLHSDVFYMADNSNPGEVIAFKLDTESGSLSTLSKQKSTGDKTVQTVVDPAGRWLLAISSESRMLEVFSLSSDGSLGDDDSSGGGSGSGGAAVHTEHFVEEPTAVYTGATTGVYVVFESTSQVVTYKLDSSTGKLQAGSRAILTLSSDAKPTRMAMSSNGRYAYVLEQEKASVTTLLVRPDSSLVFSTQRHAVAIVPEDVAAQVEAGEKAAQALELQASPSGDLLLASAKVTDVATGESVGYLAVLRVRSSERGTVEAAEVIVSAGTEPRSLSFSPDGSHVLVVDADAADGADNVLLFKVAANGGGEGDEATAVCSPVVSLALPSRPRSAVMIPIGSKS